MKKLKTEIYADGANIKEIFEANNNKKISGLTTNPSLMLNSGVLNYKAFAKEILCKVKKKSISFEITLDNENAAYSQAIESASLMFKENKNVIVSHRSGETNHSYIIDIAVGIGAKYVKIGSPCRGERVAKFNRLLEIEHALLRMNI